MLESFTYQMPTKIIYGVDALSTINRYIGGRKTLLLTSEGFIKRGLVDTIKSLSPSISLVLPCVKSHPEFKDVENIYNEAIKHNFELILAVGGGSVLDTAKFISVQNREKSYHLVEAIAKGNAAKREYSLIPIIAMPTTSGTGSELTPWATMWDMEERKKYSLHLKDLFCEKAIYDPNLTLTVPKDITIYTGLDTFSHALESIWNRNANPITINNAIQSAQLTMKYLVALSDNLSSIEYRDKIMKASLFSGLAFSNTQTAIAHGMSYYITINKGVPHGIACSFTLPMLIDKIIGKYEFIDQALLEIFGELSSKKIRELFQQLGISNNFEDYGLDSKEFEELYVSLENNQRAGNSLVHIGKEL